LLEIPVSLVFESELDDFENETISIEIAMYNAPHATVIDWAEISIELEGTDYTLVYDSEAESYSVDIWLGTLAPGIYNLTLATSAIDCETEIEVIQLEIYPKMQYNLSLDADEEVQAGQSMQIMVSATDESGSVSGLLIEVHILVVSSTELIAPAEFIEEITTNSEGLALLEFDIPSDATSLSIRAEFAGSESEWSAISNTVDRNVTPGGIDILSFIISLFEDPITLTIILGGGCGLGAGVLLLRRRRRRPRVPKVSVAEEVIPPSVEPTAPAGEMDILKEEIKQYPVGLTRSQIAKALDISISKAGVLVKKLLESDSRFREFKEGRLRRIRFLGGE
jgi:hypothetical protein